MFIPIDSITRRGVLTVCGTLMSWDNLPPNGNGILIRKLFLLKLYLIRPSLEKKVILLKIMQLHDMYTEMISTRNIEPEY